MILEALSWVWVLGWLTTIPLLWASLEDDLTIAFLISLISIGVWPVILLWISSEKNWSLWTGGDYY